MAKQERAVTDASREYDASFDKGREQRGQGERLGRKVDGEPTHPEERRTGRKAGSNVGQDETSGDG